MSKKMSEFDFTRTWHTTKSTRKGSEMDELKEMFESMALVVQNDKKTVKKE